MRLDILALNQEGFVFDPELGNSYRTNPIGIEIIQLLKKQLSKDEILQNVLQNYEVDEEEARKDLDEYMQSLRQLGLSQ